VITARTLRSRDVTLAQLAATMRRLPRWAIAGAILFTAKFLVWLALVATNIARPADLAMTIAFQRIASDALDLLANAETVVGQGVVTIALAAVLAFVLWRGFGPVAALAPLLILATVPIELLFKSVLQHPAPPREFIRAFHNLLGVRIETSASFPSGHVTRLTFLVLVAASLYPRAWMPAAAALFLVLVVFLRVYIGDHWISDALAGIALGGAFASLAVGWIRASIRR
jgi:membrane-associated phospholipid phosphatase